MCGAADCNPGLGTLLKEVVFFPIARKKHYIQSSLNSSKVSKIERSVSQRQMNWGSFFDSHSYAVQPNIYL